MTPETILPAEKKFYDLDKEYIYWFALKTDTISPKDETEFFKIGIITKSMNTLHQRYKDVIKDVIFSIPISNKTEVLDEEQISKIRKVMKKKLDENPNITKITGFHDYKNIYKTTSEELIKDVQWIIKHMDNYDEFLNDKVKKQSKKPSFPEKENIYPKIRKSERVKKEVDYKENSHSSSELIDKHSYNSSSRVIKDNQYIHRDNIVYNNIIDNTDKYYIKEVKADGSCFFRALYFHLKAKDLVLNFVKCLDPTNILSEKISKVEHKFVRFIRNYLAIITKNNDDYGYSEENFKNLKNIQENDINTFKQIIEISYGDEHKYNKNINSFPKSLKQYQKDKYDEIKDFSNYVNEYEIELLKKLLKNKCDKDFKNIIVINNENGIMPDKFIKNIIYLLRVNDNHYQAIIQIDKRKRSNKSSNDNSPPNKHIHKKKR